MDCENLIEKIIKTRMEFIKLCGTEPNFLFIKDTENLARLQCWILDHCRFSDMNNAILPLRVLGMDIITDDKFVSENFSDRHDFHHVNEFAVFSHPEPKNILFYID